MVGRTLLSAVGYRLFAGLAVFEPLTASSPSSQELGQTDMQDIDVRRPSAEQGNGEAQLPSLGSCMTTAAGGPQDHVEAARCYRLAAVQGFAEAQFNLGVMYNNGRGVPQDDAEAVRWYRLAAEQGDADAQYSLGVMYRGGRGVSQDATEAVLWYRLAADQGHAAAQYNLGVRYRTGQGVPQDATEALRWNRLAADQGHAAAQYRLGLMCRLGRGVPQDYVMAYMWLNLATARASAEDRDRYARTRDAVAAEIPPEHIAEAQRRARDWKPAPPLGNDVSAFKIRLRGHDRGEVEEHVRGTNLRESVAFPDVATGRGQGTEQAPATPQKVDRLIGLRRDVGKCLLEIGTAAERDGRALLADDLQSASGWPVDVAAGVGALPAAGDVDQADRGELLQAVGQEVERLIGLRHDIAKRLHEIGTAAERDGRALLADDLQSAGGGPVDVVAGLRALSATRVVDEAGPGGRRQAGRRELDRLIGLRRNVAKCLLEIGTAAERDGRALLADDLQSAGRERVDAAGLRALLATRVVEEAGPGERLQAVRREIDRLIGLRGDVAKCLLEIGAAAERAGRGLLAADPHDDDDGEQTSGEMADPTADGPDRSLGGPPTGPQLA